MSESISQGIPCLDLNDNIKLYKSNDISFTNLKKDGFNCNNSNKKPDQFVAKGKNIIIAIEEKKSSHQLEEAINQLKDNYLDSLPSTDFFIARAGDRTKVFYRTLQNQISEIGTTFKGKEALCFARKVITGQNNAVQINLALLSEQVLIGQEPVNGAIEKMEDKNHPPILIENETENKKNKLISWNIKGDPCKDIRMHNKPFYATENRGLITIINDEVDFDYILYYLKEHLIDLGNFKRSDEAHAGKVKKIKIKIPINDKGKLDLEKQKLIAKNYNHIIELRKNVKDKIFELEELMNNIDVFK